MRQRLEPSQFASASFVNLRSRTAATVLLTIVFLALHAGFHVRGRDPSQLVVKLADLSAAELGTPASFDRGSADRELIEDQDHLLSSQRPVRHRPVRGVSPVNREHSLRQIAPDRDNLRHDRCGSSQTQLGTSLPSGGSHSINADPAPRFSRQRRARHLQSSGLVPALHFQRSPSIGPESHSQLRAPQLCRKNVDGPLHPLTSQFKIVNSR
ncbi:hypothetical protein KO516_22690 [Citreicella sp. C3M06]|nr:hypothetical protein [Citreicella sp. C3M06]